MPTTERHSPPRRSDSLRIRARLLDEARAMLAIKGPPLQLNELARRAGVGVGTVYRHFATAQALLEALAIDPLRELLEIARAAVDDPDPWSGLERLLRARTLVRNDNAGVSEVLAETKDKHPETAALLDELDRRCEAVLERARTAGVVRDDIDAGDVRRLLCGVEYAARIGGDDQDRLTELYLRVLIDGLRIA